MFEGPQLPVYTAPEDYFYSFDVGTYETTKYVKIIKIGRGQKKAWQVESENARFLREPTLNELIPVGSVRS